MKKLLLSCLCVLVAATPGFAAKKLKLAFVTNNASDFWTIARAR